MIDVLFTIPGPPRTKKNHGWRTKQGRQMPSHAFTEWNQAAQIHLRKFLNNWTGPRDTFPILIPVNCEALFYRHARVGDAVGFYQALADALEEAGIVENDKLVVSWDGSRLATSKDPQIVVRLTEPKN